MHIKSTEFVSLLVAGCLQTHFPSIECCVSAFQDDSSTCNSGLKGHKQLKCLAWNLGPHDFMSRNLYSKPSSSRKSTRNYRQCAVRSSRIPCNPRRYRSDEKTRIVASSLNPAPIPKVRLGSSDLWVPEIGFSASSWGDPRQGYGFEYTDPMLEQVPFAPLV